MNRNECMLECNDFFRIITQASHDLGLCTLFFSRVGKFVNKMVKCPWHFCRRTYPYEIKTCFHFLPACNLLFPENIKLCNIKTVRKNTACVAQGKRPEIKTDQEWYLHVLWLIHPTLPNYDAVFWDHQLIYNIFC